MVIISQEEHERIKDIKTLELEICDFGHLNILNLGWEPFKKFNISRTLLIGCESQRTKEPVKA